MEIARLLNADFAAALLAIVGSYALGCFNAGYYLVRWRTGQDVRAHGSGNAGATNVGRLLGRKGSYLVLALDLAKGATAVAVARWLGVPPWGVGLAGIAAVAGHVWPAQLAFRGGKGVATALGVLLVGEPRLILALAVLCILIFVFVRRFTLAGLLAFALAPIVSLFFHPARSTVACTGGVTLMVLLAHRKNFREEWARWRGAAPMHSPARISKDVAR